MQIGSEMAKLQEKNPKMDPKKRFFSTIPQDFELLKQVPESSHQTVFWSELIYWNINFVLKCLTAHCEAHRPPIENQCFHQVQWLTLQKPLPFHIGQNGCLYSHFTSFLCLPMTTWLRWLDMAAGSLPINGLTNAMVGYNWKPMLSSSPMVDSSKAIAIPHRPKWLLTNGNWLGRVARKKLPF